MTTLRGSSPLGAAGRRGIYGTGETNVTAPWNVPCQLLGGEAVHALLDSMDKGVHRGDPFGKRKPIPHPHTLLGDSQREVLFQSFAKAASILPPPLRRGKGAVPPSMEKETGLKPEVLRGDRGLTNPHPMQFQAADLTDLITRYRNAAIAHGTSSETGDWKIGKLNYDILSECYAKLKSSCGTVRRGGFNGAQEAARLASWGSPQVGG